MALERLRRRYKSTHRPYAACYWGVHAREAKSAVENSIRILTMVDDEERLACVLQIAWQTRSDEMSSWDSLQSAGVHKYQSQIVCHAFVNQRRGLNSISLAAPAPNLDPDSVNVNPEPSHACEDLIRNTRANGVVLAVDVYNFWVTVPIDRAVATRFIQYWNDTMQFQSTLDYLKEPPTHCQQLAVDLIAGLNEIYAAIDNNWFANEYQFEATIQNVICSGNDSYISLFGSLVSSFSFGTPHRLTSLSIDGIQLLKVYLIDRTKRINGTYVVD
ncbi:peptidase S41 family protein [Diaporthe amygdali]|uniref:peptidase S41 family protein n=1 Tax=Phomopsis amygdali TaxID=1214568 RepID=UPI0022FDFA40|nr:peptidase S41 family protein [Diaporthe amygdali]KAJ0122538.1 peptidase S41 family protein [Diaporthe amygdali]